jgi:selenocysteine-specific elongation factor
VQVVCTAGHVDHGKSTLVRALTGMEPDRFEEERRRGLTIDLGFAWCELSSDQTGRSTTVAFVDLPGHHRFVSNMLAGAGSVAVALVVVSADDGPMPQTQEHLEILDVLGVEHGVVAVTKTDLVDDATVEFAVELAREALADTALAKAAIVPVSAETGASMSALREALLDVLAALPQDDDEGRPRLWVDRSFSIRGAGTVVTGTLRHGSLSVDQDVVVLPGERAARVRGLQSLGRELRTAEPGSRVAMNLVGVGRGEVARGDAVVRPRQWRQTDTVEAWVRALPGREISRRGDWHVHAGSGEWRAEVVPVDGRAIGAGTDGFVRLHLARAAALRPGDHFVLRESGRQMTIGGGMVLDVAPGAAARGRARRVQRVERLRQRRDLLANGDRIGLLAAHAREHGVVDRRDAAALAGLRGGVTTESLAGRLDVLGNAWVDAADGERWRAAAVAAVRSYHDRHPIERAAPKDAASKAAVASGCPEGVAAQLLADAVSRGVLVTEGGGLRLPDHRVRLDEEQSRAAEALLTLLEDGGFAPLELSAAAAQAGATRQLVRELEASGRLVRLEPDIAMTAATLERAHEVLREAFSAEGPLTASRARELWGTTRKYALPMLAVLDRSGRTRREGDVRVVLD